MNVHVFLRVSVSLRLYDRRRIGGPIPKGFPFSTPYPYFYFKLTGNNALNPCNLHDMNTRRRRRKNNGVEIIL